MVRITCPAALKKAAAAYLLDTLQLTSEQRQRFEVDATEPEVISFCTEHCCPAASSNASDAESGKA